MFPEVEVEVEFGGGVGFEAVDREGERGVAEDEEGGVVQ